VTRSSRLALASLLAALLPASARAGLPAPPVLEWARCPSGFCEQGWYASPAVADVDGDGQVEVLWGGYRLMAVDGATGALEWTYPASGNDGRLWPSPAIANLDRGDGAPEIVIANGNGRVVVLDGSGTPRPGFPVQPFPSGEIRSLATADLDGDGTAEILVARAAGTAENQWTVLEHTGSVRHGWPQHTSTSPGYAWGCYNQNLAAGDLDGDGRLEIAATSDVHYMALFGDDGVERKAAPAFGLAGGVAKDWSEVGLHFDETWDLQGWAACGGEPVAWRPNLAESAPVIADLDRDGSAEIVLIGDFYEFCDGPYTSLFQAPIVLRADRTRWKADAFDWTSLPVPDGGGAPLARDWNVIENVAPNPTIADLDGDGLAEILYPSYDGRLHAMRLDRTEAPGWPIDLNADPGAPIRFASEAVAADLDRDGRLEVLFHVWTEKGSEQDGELRIVDWQGALLASVPFPRGDRSWSGALGAPTLANVDDDPDLEVLSGTTNAGLVAHELPGTAGARIAWGTSRGDFTRAAPEPDALAGALATAASLAALRARRARPRRGAAAHSIGSSTTTGITRLPARS